MPSMQWKWKGKVMKIAIAAYNPENPKQIVGIGTVGIADKDPTSRVEVLMRDPADVLKGPWNITVQFDPPITAAATAPRRAIEAVLNAVRIAAVQVADEIEGGKITSTLVEDIDGELARLSSLQGGTTTHLMRAKKVIRELLLEAIVTSGDQDEHT
jgi:hypothetical protein